MIAKSIYTYIFERKGKYYLYNSQTNFFSEISQFLHNVIKDREWSKLSEEEISTLMDQKIIVNEESLYDFYNATKIKFMSSAYREDRLNLVIVPTTACNFACPYCFEPKKKAKVMTVEVMDGIISFINSHKKAEDLYLTWYGGEPLLAFDIIRILYNRIKAETNVTIKHHSITTNGYLFTEDMIDFFKETELSRAQITLDGIRDRHNLTRYVKGNHAPTFDVISENIISLAKKNPSADIAIRVNINRLNYMDFVKLYNHYNTPEIPSNISVYPGIIREETSDLSSLCVNSYKNGELFRLYKLFKEHGVSINLYPRHKTKGCMMQKLNASIIGPEGEIYKCWNDVNSPNKIVGNILTLDKEPTTLFYNYVNSTFPFDDKCKDCLQFPICDGGCGFHRYRNRFERCSFDICNVYGTLGDLEDALLTSLDKQVYNKINLRL